MNNMLAGLQGALNNDDNEEMLRNEIAYYRAMLADCSRDPHNARRHLTPDELCQRLLESEQRLAALRKRRNGA